MEKSAWVESGIVTNVIMGLLPDYVPCAADVQIGWTYDGEGFVEPEPDPAPDPESGELWEALRGKRDARLSATDWLVQRHAEELELDLDTTLTPEQHTDLLTYRQALRDLPENTTDPNEPQWPEEPQNG